MGEAGNSIIEKLPQTADWTEVKNELCAVLGEGDPKKRAFEMLSCYKPKSKSLGEMATDIMANAALATKDVKLTGATRAQSISPGCAQKHWP